MPPGHMSTAQPSELACLPQEPQSRSEAQDLLLLQDYVCTHALLQQTELLVEGTQPSKPLGQRPGRRP